ncbi:MAG: hypothetical protein ACYTER_02890 [Planctomycetota bacterium]|jgi:hypothetical protein
MSQLSVISQQLSVNSQQLSVSSRWFSVVVLGILFCLCGCEGLRFAATEAQKENAWRHQQVCVEASEVAVVEDASDALCGLTAVAAEQSEAFVVDYGLPENPLFPLEQASLTGGELSALAARAKVDAARRPDVWVLADSTLELGIALAGLVGGVYGVRVAGYLKTAREKSKALQEVVQGNEVFKQLWPDYSERFKEAQAKQSAATQRLVADAKVNHE